MSTYKPYNSINYAIVRPESKINLKNKVNIQINIKKKLISQHTPYTKGNVIGSVKWLLLENIFNIFGLC